MLRRRSCGAQRVDGARRVPLVAVRQLVLGPLVVGREVLENLNFVPRVDRLPRIARRVYEVLPLTAVLERAAVVDTSSGEVHPLPRLV